MADGRVPEAFARNGPCFGAVWAADRLHAMNFTFAGGDVKMPPSGLEDRLSYDVEVDSILRQATGKRAKTVVSSCDALRRLRARTLGGQNGV